MLFGQHRGSIVVKVEVDLLIYNEVHPIYSNVLVLGIGIVQRSSAITGYTHTL